MGTMRDVLSITTRNCMVVVVIDSLKRATITQQRCDGIARETSEV